MPKHTQAKDLLDKIQRLPPDKITEVEDFVDFLRMKSDAVLASRPVAGLDEREAQAAATGLLRLPEPQARKLSTTEAPPVQVGGKPASEIVLEDRNARCPTTSKPSNERTLSFVTSSPACAGSPSTMTFTARSKTYSCDIDCAAQTPSISHPQS